MTTLENVKYNADGLVPAIAQDTQTGSVLMMAWMNAEALNATLETRRGTYWSRSREKLWVKGESSGHIQHVKSVSLDCDGDTILLAVDQIGPACHTGAETCFTGRDQLMHALGAVTPTKDEFLHLARHHRVIPVTMKLLADAHTPLSIYRALAADEHGAGQPGTFLMESAAPGAAWSRYSFIGVRSLATLTEKDGQAHWLGDPPAGTPTTGSTAEVLRKTLDFLGSRAFAEGLPHLTSGLVGYVGWDVVRQWERLPHPPADALGLPDMAMNLISDVAVHDNRDGTVTLIANAINTDGRSSGAEQAYDDAAARLNSMRDELARPVAPGLSAAQEDWTDAVEDDLQHKVKHSWDQNEYLATLSKAKQAIVDGDVFQIVVSRRFEVETDVDALAVYRMLRLLNPSPYMYLMHFQTPGVSRIRWSEPRQRHSSLWMPSAMWSPTQLPGLARAGPRQPRTVLLRKICSPIRRNALSTLCSSTWRAMTWPKSACPVPWKSQSSWESSTSAM